MHYYKFNIGDYRKDTAHLTRLEHSIYRDLIDWYYLDEKPIPNNTQSVMRRLRLGSEMKDDLTNVLNDFFSSSSDGWVHARIDADIAEYHRNAEKNRKNGRKGGRPKVNNKPTGLPVGYQSEPNGNLNYKPLTKNQEPLTNTTTVHNTTTHQQTAKIIGGENEKHS